MELMWIKSIIGLTIIGIIGAKISKEINLGNLGWYWAILASVLSGGLWGWMVKHQTSLTYMSIVFDVVYTAAYIGTFIYLGDKLNAVQTSGLFISIIGIILMGLH